MPLRPTESALESKAERIARMLTRQYGVRVRVEGSLAYVDAASGEIVLPNLSTAHLEVLGEALDGFLDHECAHLLYTEFVRASALREPARGIWNALEDALVERAMGRQFRGCRENLQVLDRLVGAKVIDEWEGVSLGARFLYVVGRFARLGFCPEGVAIDPALEGLIERVRPLLERAVRLESTAEAVALAQEIARVLCREFPASPTPPPPVEDGVVTVRVGGECEGAQGEPEKDKGAGEAEGEPTPADGVRELIIGDGPKLDAEWLVNALCEQAAAQNGSGRTSGGPVDYLVYSTAYDRDRVFTSQERYDWSGLYSKLRAEVSDYIGTMAARLELALAAEAQVRWVGGERHGRRWDRRALGRWFLGGEDDRVFARKEQGPALDTAVSLLWDCSGSMGSTCYSGSKASLARLAAIAFHEALLRANVPHEVLAFNTAAPNPPELSAQVAKVRAAGLDLSGYSRLDEIDNRMVLVPFSGTDGRAICAIDGNDANRDGECVLWAAKRLAARPERRKVLLVGSDGIPQGAIWGDTEYRYLKQVVAQVSAAGIEVIGIGIMSKTVRDFYPRWVVLREISALPEAVMQELINLLTSEAHRGSAKGAVSDH